MNFAERVARVLAVLAVAMLAGSCGGGSSTETTITGGGTSGGGGTAVSAVDSPTGPNTTEVIVDSGPASGFSLGAANIAYVTVTVCAPGSASACATIDHVLLDTGSVGLRVLKSAVASLSLPAVTVASPSGSGQPNASAVECYPFVLGALWGGLAVADVHVAQELAAAVPVQLIDDATPPSIAPTADCVAASNGGLLNSAAMLQANGILGVGMTAFDCGLNCVNGDYSSGYTLYYACQSGAGAACQPTAIPIASQMQNPVAHFATNNNGTMIVMPALPDLGSSVAKGRLVFGIGTQANNQIPPTAKILFVDPNPASAGYLYLSTQVGATVYPNSYIDSGSNALFFDDASIARGCQSSSGSTGGWYCPSTLLRGSATLMDWQGASASAAYAVANADALFSTSSLAFADLAGSVTQGSGTFVWGLPFFYGRTVFTSIWGQALSPNGPWNAY